MADHPPTLDHIEKTFADAYRKEIDQEENVWRTLPFFAATLALQLAALFQIVERLPVRQTTAWWLAAACGTVTGLSTMIALSFLAVSIYPVEFRYIAAEPDLWAYAKELIEDEGKNVEGQVGDAVNALGELKAALTLQYAEATHHNRQINQRRALWRSIAGLATLTSVIATLALVITIALTYAPRSN